MTATATATTFRHKCPPRVNPKYVTFPDSGVHLHPDYPLHVRREYPIPPDAEWAPIMAADPRRARLGVTRATGREMAVVQCPDCGDTVVVTRVAREG